MQKKKIIELKPIKESTKDYEEIETRIKDIFRKLIYIPLLDELDLKSKKILNSKNDLNDALQSGKVTYSRGAFRGKFSATVSKELRRLGAKWDKATSSFKIGLEDVPYDIRSAINSSEVHFRAKLDRIDKKINKILPEEIAEQIKVADLFDAALWKVEKDFHKSVENITVTPKLTSYQRAKIADEWQNNMDLWIKDFTEKEIINLRKTINKSIFAGNRYESLIKGIETSYGVTTRKAKFLARQETSLLMTKYKESRYTEAGVHEYKWATVKMPHDKKPGQHTLGNVRYAHGILEGKIFRWDNPPITSNPGEPEKRNNPGNDYNCRCFAIPVLRG